MMQFDTPKTSVWWIAVTIGLLGILGHFITIPIISVYSFWFVVIGFLLLASSTF
ncbi:MAG: hypothetical protein ABFS03_10440 [Chloroflexota bacterium]